MVKIIMHGCNGHMGQVITGLVKEDANAEIIAGIDMNDNGQNDYPVFKSLAECDVPADVVVDFSSYKAADALLDACKEKKLPLVLCTTGLTEDQLKKVQETSKEIPVLLSSCGDCGRAYQEPGTRRAGTTKSRAPSGVDLILGGVSNSSKPISSSAWRAAFDIWARSFRLRCMDGRRRSR